WRGPERWGGAGRPRHTASWRAVAVGKWSPPGVSGPERLLETRLQRRRVREASGGTRPKPAGRAGAPKAQTPFHYGRRGTPPGVGHHQAGPACVRRDKGKLEGGPLPTRGNQLVALMLLPQPRPARSPIWRWK